MNTYSIKRRKLTLTMEADRKGKGTVTFSPSSDKVGAKVLQILGTDEARAIGGGAYETRIASGLGRAKMCEIYRLTIGYVPELLDEETEIRGPVYSYIADLQQAGNLSAQTAHNELREISDRIRAGEIDEAGARREVERLRKAYG